MKQFSSNFTRRFYSLEFSNPFVGIGKHYFFTPDSVALYNTIKYDIAVDKSFAFFYSLLLPVKGLVIHFNLSFIGTNNIVWFCIQAQERHGTAEDRIQRLEAQVDEKNAELIRLNQRLKMNEEHNTRLSSTVDKLLSGTVNYFYQCFHPENETKNYTFIIYNFPESNERLQSHLKERMNSIEEKNCLTQDLEKTRKIIEELQMEKVCNSFTFSYFGNMKLINFSLFTERTDKRT